MEQENLYDLFSKPMEGVKEENEFNYSYMEPSNDDEYMNSEPFGSTGDLNCLNNFMENGIENNYNLGVNYDDLDIGELLKNIPPSFDLNESGSDSGLSVNADAVNMSPPSGIVSPDPRGDISVDTLDAVSDVSSTSDLGSAYSFNSSPSSSNSRVASIGLDSLSDDIDIKYSPPQNNIYFSQSNVPNAPKLNVKTITTPAEPITQPIVTQCFTIPAQRPVVSNFKLLDSTSNAPKIVSIKQCGNGKFNILKRLQLDPSKQTVVTKANTLQLANIQNRTIVKTTTANNKSVSQPAVLPIKLQHYINTHNMQNVKNITVYNPVNKGENPRMVSVVDQYQLLNASKTTDNRTHFKVSPATIEPYKLSPTFTIKEEEDSSSSDEETPQQGQRLILSEEEKRLMRKEGITLPPRYPLTKHEEKDLKRIRRKIRNKKSAQDSRKRKKEYVDGLEDRVKLCSDENQQLQKKIITLEKQNENLSVQLKRFQNLIGYNLNSRSHNHASTALMMLILSAALIVVPSLRPQEGKGENELTSNAKMPNSGRSRTLLETGTPILPFNNNRNTENTNNLEMFEDEDVSETNSFSSGALSDHDYEPSAKKMRPDSLFVNPSMSTSYSNKEPPDNEQKGVYALLGAMLHRLGTNWTDPGGSNLVTTKSPMTLTPDSSVVVNLNRTLDDIEVE